MRVKVKGHGDVEGDEACEGMLIGDNAVYDGSLDNPPNGEYEPAPPNSAGKVIGAECRSKWVQLRSPLPPKAEE